MELQEYFEIFSNWAYRWQTLITGLMALLAAYITLLSIRNQVQEAAIFSHRSEVFNIQEELNGFFLYASEMSEYLEMLRKNPEEEHVAALLMHSIETFKGLAANSSDATIVAMQKMYGRNMLSVDYFLAAVDMLCNERVYGYTTTLNLDKRRSKWNYHRKVFDGEDHFVKYLKEELTTAAKLFAQFVSYVDASQDEPPIYLARRRKYRSLFVEMLNWSRRIAKDTRGDEYLFECLRNPTPKAEKPDA